MASGSGIHAACVCLAWRQVEDLAPACCAAWGVAVRADRPCHFYRGLLSRAECDHLLATMCSAHDKEGRSTEVGERSEFSAVDAELSRLLWTRVGPHLPAELDGGTAVGLRCEFHNARYFEGQSVFAHMDMRQTSQEHRWGG